MTRENETIGYADAVQQAARRMSPRARRLAQLESWVDGTQYAGLADWFEDVPIGEKAPCIVDPIVADAIESHVDMVLGEGRFPALTTRPGDDEAPEDDAEDAGALSEEDSERLDRVLEAVVEQSRFPAVCREALGMAMGCGSVGTIYGARAGRLFGDTVKARWCEPEFLADGRTVRQLVIQYPYVEVYVDPTGTWRARARIFRRVIDEQADTTFLPAEVNDPKPRWVVDTAATVAHGLGFCPVVWYPFFRGCSIAGQIDGRAPHGNPLGMIQAHDVALSQRHRAAVYAGDPQWTECGVEKGANPSSGGRVNPLPITQRGGLPASDNPVVGRIIEESNQTTGRKKHPGAVWQYEDKDVKVKLHTLDGAALDAVSKHAQDIRLKLMQALAYVPLDPESANVVRGTLSGKALDTLRQRQLNRDDRIRDDFGDGFIRPSVSMLLRIANAKRDGLRVRGLTRAAGVLARFEVADPAEVSRAVA